MPGHDRTDVGGVKRILIGEMMEIMMDPSNLVFRKYWGADVLPRFIFANTKREARGYTGVGHLLAFQILNDIGQADHYQWQQFFLGDIFANDAVGRGYQKDHIKQY